MIKISSQNSSIDLYKNLIFKIDHGDDLGITNVLLHIKNLYNIVKKNKLEHFFQADEIKKRTRYHSDKNIGEFIVNIGLNDFTSTFEVISNSKMHVFYSLVMPLNIFSESNQFYISDIERIINGVLNDDNYDLNNAKIQLLSVLKKMLLSYQKDTLINVNTGKKDNSIIANYDKNAVHNYSFNELMKFYKIGDKTEIITMNNANKILKTCIKNESASMVELHKEDIFNILYTNNLLSVSMNKSVKDLPFIKQILINSNIDFVKKISEKYKLDITSAFSLLRSLPDYDKDNTEKNINDIEFLLNDKTNLDFLVINLINQNNADLAIAIDKKYNIINKINYAVHINSNSYTIGSSRNYLNPNEKLLNNKTKLELQFARKLKDNFSDRVNINLILKGKEYIYFYNADLINFLYDVDGDLIFSDFYKKSNKTIVKSYMEGFINKYSCDNMDELIPIIEHIKQAIPFYEKAIDKNAKNGDETLFDNISFN